MNNLVNVSIIIFNPAESEDILVRSNRAPVTHKCMSSEFKVLESRDKIRICKV